MTNRTTTEPFGVAAGRLSQTERADAGLASHPPPAEGWGVWTMCCGACGRRWVAVAPVEAGDKPFECPSCGQMKGEPMKDLRYTTGAPAENECRVYRDGARVLLEPHTEHIDGQCSCGVEPLVLDVDVTLARIAPGCWLVTRSDGAVLGHLTDVPEPALWEVSS